MSLILTAVIEPVFFHPFIVYWSLQGNWDIMFGKNEWGVMIKEGFSKTKIITNLNDIPAEA